MKRMIRIVLQHAGFHFRDHKMGAALAFAVNTPQWKEQPVPMRSGSVATVLITSVRA
jgi:hypothetical protein